MMATWSYAAAEAARPVTAMVLRGLEVYFVMALDPRVGVLDTRTSAISVSHDLRCDLTLPSADC